MRSEAATVPEYLDSLAPDRRAVIEKLRALAKKQMPKGFEEIMNYGMIGYVVPHKLYPAGYHCDPKLPLPFVAIASQKNFVALYHMGLYSEAKTLKWFTSEWPKRTPAKLDMGKSCLRFKKFDALPYELLGELLARFTVKDWVAVYESSVKKRTPSTFEP
jgi:Domain of unknown function (DU1801)